MKFREGFVSNSSSTSFCLYVENSKIIAYWALPEWLKKNRIEDHTLELLIMGGTDGDWYKTEATSELLDLLVNKYINKRISRTPWILVDAVWIDEDSEAYWYCKTPKGCEGWHSENINADWHEPKTLEEWDEYFSYFVDNE